MFYVNYFTSLIYHSLNGCTMRLLIISQYRQNENPYFTNQSYQSANNKDSNSFNFSSNTWHASSIGCALVISTPAAFNTSIG